MYRLPAQENQIVPRSFNFGPPQAQPRSQTLRSTLLGDEHKFAAWPRRLRVGLIFPPKVSPLAFMLALLKTVGLASPQALTDRRYPLPLERLTLRTVAGGDGFCDTSVAPVDEILHQALLLGLCGIAYYDPVRPIVWTNASLGRRLELFAVGDFYADD